MTAELRELIDRVMAAHEVEPPGGVLPPVWETLVELGLPLVGVPEDVGGSGGTLGDVAALVQSLAWHGVSAPLVEASVANWATMGLAASPGLTTIALVEQGIDVSCEHLAGQIPNVPWASLAARIAVFGPSGAWLIDVEAPGVGVERGQNVAGEPRDVLQLDRCPARVLVDAPDRRLVRARLGVLWSAAICGAASGAYELTRRYVSEREQFGRPLVAIPAVASALARMRVQVVEVQASVNRALQRWDRSVDECSTAAAVARITSSRVATEVAHLAHQLHGAIGITREYPLHRRTRRLWAWRDAELPEREWLSLLGSTVVAQGEPALWDQISA